MTTTSGTEKLLGTPDLARRWRTTEQGIYAARHRGDCPPALRVGKRLLWRARDIEAWEAARVEPDGAGARTSALAVAGWRQRSTRTA